MDFHLDTLLNFPNVTIESCLQQSNEVYLKLRFLNEESRCPHCEDLSSELHQVRPIVIRDLSVFGQPTYLKVPRRQFYCRGCQRYFTEVLAFMEAGRHYTRRYEAHIYQQVKLSGIEPVSHIKCQLFWRPTRCAMRLGLQNWTSECEADPTKRPDRK